MPCCPSPFLLEPRSRDGHGVAAAFDTPAAIVYVRDNDSYYIADAGSNEIRRYNRHGDVTTVAGACERELLTGFCIGRELDGFGRLARFDRPAQIAYDQTQGELVIYDAGSGTVRLMTLDGRVTTAGKASEVTSLAVSPIRDRWFAARGASVVELLWSPPSSIQIIHIWTPPNIRKCCPEGAPAQSVNQIAVDPKSGNIFASVFTACIYRINIPHSLQATLLAGDCIPSACLGPCQLSRDGSGSNAKFRSLSALAFDAKSSTLFAAEFQSIRSISQSGLVQTVAGACIKHAGYRGEFTCDYPSEDGPPQHAHFSWPIRSLAVDGTDGSLMVLDNDLLRRIDRFGFVRTVAGNRKAQTQRRFTSWNSRYEDTVSRETVDVYVRGDDEIEVFRNGSGKIFDVRRGSRSAAFDPAEFWIAPTYVRVGAAPQLGPYEPVKRSLGCGTGWALQQKNPYQTSQSAKSERLFIGWYSQFAKGQRPEFATSEHCGAFRLYDAKGSEVYEDYESRVITHIVPDGLLEYADQRRLFR